MVLARKESRVAILVDHIVVAVLRDVILKEPKTVGVNGADEHGAEPIPKGLAHPVGDTPMQASHDANKR